MNRLITVALLSGALAGCTNEPENAAMLKSGMWRAVIGIQGQELPFNFEVTRDDTGGYDATLINGDERLLLDEITVSGDSVDMKLHIFDADLKARLSGDSLIGVFVKNYEKDYRLPFRAAFGQDYRFVPADSSEQPVDFTGKYAVTFTHRDTVANETDTTEAVGIFHQSGNQVTGTFLTSTGDYRFLEGNTAGRELQLTTFDGNHTYLFRATMEEGGGLRGDFFSGKTRRDTWVAKRNDDARLPDAESLTYLKEGYDRIAFRFPDVDGRPVSLDDEKYRGKVVILQLMGSWCPNCMDETRFLAPWYHENKDRGVAIIGLAYERLADFDYASARVKKMVQRMGIEYEVLIAGTNEAGVAAKSLPMLNNVMAFPTTIFIGKDGKVKKIHTGFNGPGTGAYYDQFIQDFNETVNELLKEDLTAER